MRSTSSLVFVALLGTAFCPLAVRADDVAHVPRALSAARITLAQSIAPTVAGYAPQATPYVPATSACTDAPSSTPTDDNALPAGYTLAAGVVIPSPPTGAARVRYNALADELKRVEEELDQLKDRHVSIGGPVTAMVVGYGLTLGSTMTALWAYESARNHDHGSAHHREYRDLAYGFTGVAAIGLITGLWGSVALSHRLDRRDALSVQRNDVVSQRNLLRKQLDYGFNTGPQQFQLGVRGQF